eukprot:8290_1
MAVIVLNAKFTQDGHSINVKKCTKVSTNSSRAQGFEPFILSLVTPRAMAPLIIILQLKVLAPASFDPFLLPSYLMHNLHNMGVPVASKNARLALPPLPEHIALNLVLFPSRHLKQWRSRLCLFLPRSLFGTTVVCLAAAKTPPPLAARLAMGNFMGKNPEFGKYNGNGYKAKGFRGINCGNFHTLG